MEGEGLSSEEAQTRMQSADEELSSDVEALLVSGSFAATMEGLFTPSSTTSGEKEHTRPFGAVLLEKLDTEIETTNGRLDFSASTGIYAWDEDQEDWTKAGTSDDIVLRFPTSRGASNDAEFTLSAYADTDVAVEGESIYLPTRIDASLTVDGTGEVFAVDLTDTDFYGDRFDGTQVPKGFFLEVLTAPQLHTVEWASPSKQEFEVAFDLRRADDDYPVLGLLAAVTLKDDFDQVSGAQGIAELSGELNLGPDVVIAYTAQVDELAALDEDPTEAEVNDRVTAVVNHRGQKIGTLEFDRERGPLLVYNDGSTEPLTEIFDDTLTHMGSSSTTISRVVKTAAQAVQKTVVKAF